MRVADQECHLYLYVLESPLIQTLLFVRKFLDPGQSLINVSTRPHLVMPGQ